MRRLRVAACQINPMVGDVSSNVELVLRTLERAEAAGADVAVFPEMTVSGYPPEDLVLKPGFIADCRQAVAEIARRTRGCAAVVGTVASGGPASRRNTTDNSSIDKPAIYNAAVLCADGRVVLEYHKRKLPNYSVFDEQRYFTPGDHDYELVEIAGVRVGLAICEDIWTVDGPLVDQAAGGAEILLVPNGSPYRMGKVLERDQMLRRRAGDNHCAIAYVNQVGGQDELVFDGASSFYDQQGRLLARAPQFETAVTICDVPIEEPPAVGPAPSGSLFVRRLPLSRGAGTTGETAAPAVPGQVDTTGRRPVVESSSAVAELLDLDAEIWQALVVGTRDYVQKNGFSEVGVALSGGIDSSIVVALAVDALGPDRVHAVLMPSRFSSDHSVSDSIALCNELGVEHRIIPIEPAHESLLDMLAPSFAGHVPDTTEENLQSRIRGVVMMALSNKLGWMILTTGNKSEIAVGYSTLYGDTAGGYAVIKDVFKTRVYQLCRWRNRTAGREIIPSQIIEKAPSAELRHDQRDDQSLPPYDVLDAILRDYVEGDLTLAELIDVGHDADVARRIVRLVDVAEYKRRQNPPGIRISSKAFGRDRRMPITNGYRG